MLTNPENSVSRAYIMKIISETRSEHQSRCTCVMVIVEGELLSSCLQLITKNER
jgi:aerobic-type carbon monoxide dehydrogenase small subunit (CoxS/CutS family)